MDVACREVDKDAMVENFGTVYAGVACQDTQALRSNFSLLVHAMKTKDSNQSCLACKLYCHREHCRTITRFMAH